MLIGGGTVLTVAIATVIPAWRAGRVSPVAAVQPSPPRGHLSLIARLGLLVHLPAPLVLGARDSLTRRLPAVLTVVGLAIPMVMITIALTCWSTVDSFTRDPGKIGLAAAVTVSQGGLGEKQTLALISGTTRYSRPIRARSSTRCSRVSTAPSSPGPWGTPGGRTPSRWSRGACSTRRTRRWPARVSWT